MNRRCPRYSPGMKWLVALALVAALPLAASAGASSRKGATVKVAKAGNLGQVIVSARGISNTNAVNPTVMYLRLAISFHISARSKNLSNQI